MKTKAWVILIASVFAVLCGVSFALYHLRPQSTVANVYQDGVCILSIDLSAVTGTESYTVTDGDGHENIIEVEHGRIRISEANCPDQVCVDTGWISGSLKPIVCLPAKLVIQIESNPATEALKLDAVSG